MMIIEGICIARTEVFPIIKNIIIINYDKTHLYNELIL